VLDFVLHLQAGVAGNVVYCSIPATNRAEIRTGKRQDDLPLDVVNSARFLKVILVDIFDKYLREFVDIGSPLYNAFNLNIKPELTGEPNPVFAGHFELL